MTATAGSESTITEWPGELKPACFIVIATVWLSTHRRNGACCPEPRIAGGGLAPPGPAGHRRRISGYEMSFYCCAFIRLPFSSCHAAMNKAGPEIIRPQAFPPHQEPTPLSVSVHYTSIYLDVMGFTARVPAQKRVFPHTEQANMRKKTTKLQSRQSPPSPNTC